MKQGKDIFQLANVKVKGFEAINSPKTSETGVSLAKFNASEFAKSTGCLTCDNNANLISASSIYSNLICGANGANATLAKMAYAATTQIAASGGRMIKFIVPKTVGHIKYMAGLEKDVFRNRQPTLAQRQAHIDAFLPLVAELKNQAKDREIGPYTTYLDNVGRDWQLDKTGKPFIASEDRAARAQALSMGAWLAAGKPTK